MNTPIAAARSADYSNISREAWLSGPPETSADEEDGLDMPVNPDESNPIIPDDDERVVNVPS